jgi:hypothetical protein
VIFTFALMVFESTLEYQQATYRWTLTPCLRFLMLEMVLDEHFYKFGTFVGNIYHTCVWLLMDILMEILDFILHLIQKCISCVINLFLFKIKIKETETC